MNSPSAPAAVYQNERVSEILATAQTLGATAAILDPSGETLYTGYLPVAPITHPSVWWMGISGWLSLGGMSWIARQMLRKQGQPVSVWYVATHQQDATRHYYVDVLGTLYISSRDAAAPAGRVPLAVLSGESLDASPSDDLEHLLIQLKRQRVWQEHYRARR